MIEIEMKENKYSWYRWILKTNAVMQRIELNDLYWCTLYKAESTNWFWKKIQKQQPSIVFANSHSYKRQKTEHL